MRIKSVVLRRASRSVPGFCTCLPVGPVCLEYISSMDVSSTIWKGPINIVKQIQSRFPSSQARIALSFFLLPSPLIARAKNSHQFQKVISSHHRGCWVADTQPLANVGPATRRRGCGREWSQQQVFSWLPPPCSTSCCLERASRKSASQPSCLSRRPVK